MWKQHSERYLLPNTVFEKAAQMAERKRKRKHTSEKQNQVVSSQFDSKKAKTLNRCRKYVYPLEKVTCKSISIKYIKNLHDQLLNHNYAESKQGFMWGGYVFRIIEDLPCQTEFHKNA